MLTAKEQKLLDALEPTAAASGVEIVTLEIMGSKKAPTIRVFIDTEEGVSFDELASAQVWINRIMDEIDPFREPTCSRFLLPESTGPSHEGALRPFAGEQVAVKTLSPIDGRSSFTGTLEGVEGDDVIVEVDGSRIAIGYSLIRRAHVVGAVDFS